MTPFGPKRATTATTTTATNYQISNNNRLFPLKHHSHIYLYISCWFCIQSEFVGLFSSKFESIRVRESMNTYICSRWNYEVSSFSHFQHCQLSGIWRDNLDGMKEKENTFLLSELKIWSKKETQRTDFRCKMFTLNGCWGELNSREQWKKVNRIWFVYHKIRTLCCVWI